LVDPGFSDYLVANHLGVLFSQLFGQAEQYTIDQMISAAQGNQPALDGLWSFVTPNMADAAFDPAGDFRVHEWSGTTPPIPEQSSIVLSCLGLAVLAWTARRGTAHSSMSGRRSARNQRWWSLESRLRRPSPSAPRAAKVSARLPGSGTSVVMRAGWSRSRMKSWLPFFSRMKTS
jgi:hypothetical protein